jgi:hypothetical protein
MQKVRVSSSVILTGLQLPDARGPAGRDGGSRAANGDGEALKVLAGHDLRNETLWRRRVLDQVGKRHSSSCISEMRICR